MNAITTISKEASLDVGLVRGEIRNLISQDELLSACQKLRKVIEDYGMSGIDEVLILERGIFSLERKQRTGTLDIETESKERDRLTDRLLKILDNTLQMHITNTHFSTGK